MPPPLKDGGEGPGGLTLTTLCSGQFPGCLEDECVSFPHEQQTLTYLEQHGNI